MDNHYYKTKESVEEYIELAELDDEVICKGTVL